MHPGWQRKPVKFNHGGVKTRKWLVTWLHVEFYFCQVVLGGRVSQWGCCSGRLSIKAIDHKQTLLTSRFPPWNDPVSDPLLEKPKQEQLWTFPNPTSRDVVLDSLFSSEATHSTFRLAADFSILLSPGGLTVAVLLGKSSQRNGVYSSLREAPEETNCIYIMCLMLSLSWVNPLWIISGREDLQVLSWLKRWKVESAVGRICRVQDSPNPQQWDKCTNSYLSCCKMIFFTKKESCWTSTASLKAVCQVIIR